MTDCKTILVQYHTDNLSLAVLYIGYFNMNSYMVYGRKEEWRLFCFVLFFLKYPYLSSKGIQLLQFLLIRFNGNNIHHFMLIGLDRCGDK